MAVVSDEMQRVYACGTLVIWPPDEVREVVNFWRSRFDPQSQAICEAHITLTQPFLWEPDEHEFDLIKHVVASHRSFRIEYGPLNSFLPYPCVYLEVRPSEPILRLRDDLHHLGMFDLTQPHTEGFVPHLSITDGYPDAEQSRLILAALERDAPRGTFICARASYIRPDDDYHFKIERQFSLSA